MIPTLHPRILLAVLLLGASPGLHADVGGCGAISPVAAMEADRTWIQSDHWLYLLESSGRLVRTRLDGQGEIVISTHAFDSRTRANAYVSADGRWISYGGWIAGQPLSRNWLVDTRLGKEALVLEVPKYHNEFPEFSPDGRWLAFMLGHDSRNSDNSKMGLHLIETESRRSVFVGLPPETELPAGSRAVGVYWSSDSTSLFAMTFDSENKRGFLEFSPLPDGQWSRVAGEWKNDGRPPTLMRGGKKVATTETPHPAAHTHFRNSVSSDGRWTAKIGGDQVLLVTSSDGKSIRAATGSYNDCEGSTIGIHGWVDDQFLLYSLDGKPYVLDPASGRQAPLFDDPTKVTVYFW